MRSPILIGLVCLFVLVGFLPEPADADVIVLDGDDVTDWVSVLTSYNWKHHDTCIFPNGLLKFDLTDLQLATDIIDARLCLSVERVRPPVSLEFWHVADDSWSYGYSEPDTIWDWPVWHSMGTVGVLDTMSFFVDVTDHLREEIQQHADGEFSIKVTSAGALYPDVRIASPLAPIQRMRPRIVVEYVGPLIPPIPDLAVSTADIGFSPMRPAPGETVTIRAWVRNIGAADALNVPVAFWDGEPGLGGQLIDIWIVPHIPAGGGTALAEALWGSVRGMREIYVVVDPDQAIGETDETNNADFRTFLVTDLEDYVSAVESFEYPGQAAWYSDFDAPKQFTYPGPKSLYVMRSGAEAYHGHHSTEIFLDGTADDGTVWIETAVPIEPGSEVNVNVDFEFFRYAADIAFQPVVAVSLIDPELEGDFEVLLDIPQEGWLLHSYGRTLDTGCYDMMHIAVGLTVSWEIPGTFYVDLIRTEVSQLTTAVEPRMEQVRVPAAGLLQNHPNPMGPLTTIIYRLAEDSPVSLHVYDVSGRLVKTLRDGQETAGLHEVHWDGTDEEGRPVAPGVYFYRLKTGEREESRKLLLVR